MVDSSELKRVAAVAAGLDKLVPRIGHAMRMDEDPASHGRLYALLKSAEAFLIETGPVVARANFADDDRELSERFLREMPRRLRMIRDAQPSHLRTPGKVVPMVLEGRSSPARAG